MKMQNELRAPRAGRVERVYMAEGRGVEAGARLLRLVMRQDLRFKIQNSRFQNYEANLDPPSSIMDLEF